MKPACVKCQRFYRPHKNGTRFLEMMPKGNDRAPSGTDAPESWVPYKLWNGDLWRCDGCGNEIIVGVGIYPVSEHHKPDFASEVRRWGGGFDSIIKINDC